MSDSDVSGDGLWQTGVNFKAFVVRSGSPSSSNTGPSSAYSGSYYAYCETTSPNFPGTSFDLQTNKLNGSITHLEFYYNAYGATIGTMSLQGSIDSLSWSTLWTKMGDVLDLVFDKYFSC